MRTPITSEAVQHGFSILLRHLMSYTALTLVSRAVSFFLLPVYTRMLTPADFGIVQLIEMTTDVAGLALVAGTTAGFQRFFLGTSATAERSAVISTTMGLLLGQAAIGAIVLFLAAEPIARLVLKDHFLAPLVTIAAINFLLQAIPTVPLLVLQSLQKVKLYGYLAIAKTCLQATINVVLLFQGYGVRALLYSTLITNLLLGIVVGIWVFRAYSPCWNAEIFRRIVRFGGPYRLTTAGNFILTFGDRFFLQAYHGPASVGLYGLSYQFGFLVTQLAEQPFQNAWLPQRYVQAVGAPDDRNRQNADGVLAFALLVTSIGVGIALAAKPLVLLLTTPAFASAALTVPILVLAYIVASMTNAWKFGIDYSSETRFFTYATWISVVVMLAGYAILIPKYGPMGAAIATLIGFISRAIPTIVWAQRLFPLQYEFRRTFTLIGIGCLVTILDLAVSPQNIFGMIGFGALFYFVYLGSVWFTVLSPRHRLRILSMVNTPQRKLAS